MNSTPGLHDKPVRSRRYLCAITYLFLLFPGVLSAQTTAFEKGVNLTNWFQASSAQQIDFGKYGRVDLERIGNLGFDVVRLPINLHFMTNGAPDYTLDPLFLEYLDQVADWSEELGLHLILDNHTFDPSTNTDPGVGTVLEKVWLQLATHFRDRSELIYYEVLNEPHGISDAAWNAIQQSVVDVIRSVDEVHTIIIGGAGWNSYNNLAPMPEYDDDKLIYTFHFYDPFLFSHQGASWVTPSMESLADIPFPYRPGDMPPLPAQYNGTWIESTYNDYPNTGTVEAMRDALETAVQFRQQRGVPIFLGEFGVLMNQSPEADRITWYEAMGDLLQELEIPWTMWDYHGGFGLFEKGSDGAFNHDLNLPLLEALDLVSPPQTAPVTEPVTAGLDLYRDAAAPGVELSASSSSTVELHATDQPWGGLKSIRWLNPQRYESIGFDLAPDLDLQFLHDSGYAIDFMIRGDQPGTMLTVRLVDSDTPDPADRPWRNGLVIDDGLVDWNGEWQNVHLPLTHLEEQGAWENGEWFDPQGAFDWSAIDKLEFVAETMALPGVTLGFDNVRLSRTPAGPDRLVNASGVNGLFYDTANSGHGFDFNYHDLGLTVFYYGHTGTGERLWLISDTYQAPVEYGVPMEIVFYEIVPGTFGEPGDPVTEWGTITLTLNSCNEGSALFDGVDGSFDMPLTRLVGVEGLSCSP